MTGEMLHQLADDLETAFTSARPTFLSAQERIVELCGAQWLGLQKTAGASLVMFRDPITGSSCALPEEGFTAALVTAKLKSKRAEFGAQS